MRATSPARTEAWLLDHAGGPPVNARFLRALNDPLVVPELCRFNVELNAPPVEMGAGVLAAMEESLLTTWDTCQQVAHGMDTVLAMIGILPTIRNEDLCLANMSDEPLRRPMRVAAARRRAITSTSGPDRCT
jgi:hypothetical protein